MQRRAKHETWRQLAGGAEMFVDTKRIFRALERDDILLSDITRHKRPPTAANIITCWTLS